MATNWTMDLRGQIQAILSDIHKETLLKVVNKLMEDGVGDMDDVKYVEESDLLGILSPIQCRKLLHSWKNAEVTSASTAVRCDSQSPPQSPLQMISPSPRQQGTRSDWSTMPIEVTGISPEFQRNLRKGVRPEKKLRMAFVRSVVDRMRSKKLNPTLRDCEVVARMIVDLYPASFQDELGGTILGSGFASLASQLKRRVEHAGRSDVGSRIRKPRSVTDSIGPNDVFGCLNYSPALPADQDESQQENIRQALVETYAQNGPKYVTANITTNMEDTYYLQRKDIIDSNSITELSAKWPFLFTERYLNDHFLKLTGVDALSCVSASLPEKAKLLREYFEYKGNKTPRKVRELLGEDIGSIQVLRILAAAFKEEEDGLCHLVDEAAAISDVEVRLPATPRLVIKGPSMTDGVKYMLAVDKKVVVPDISSPEAGVALLFGAYYIFNILYEETANSTLDFLQKAVFSINPEVGTRSQKYRENSKGKRVQVKKLPPISSFMQELINFSFLKTV